MAITNYLDVSDAGLIEGQIYSNGGSTRIRSGHNAESSTIIPAGFAVCLGSSATEGRTNAPCILPVDANSKFLGISLLPVGIEKRTGYSLDGNNRFGYPVGEEVAYVSEGVIAVPVDATVAIGDPVFWRHAITGSEVKGMFRNDNDGGSDAIQVGGADTCKFISAATGTAETPSIALVSINIA